MKMDRNKDREQESTITFRNTDEIKPFLKQIVGLISSRVKKDPSITALLLLVVGVLNRTYELTESAIWSIENTRPITSFHMIRGLYETLGYIYYWKEKVDSISDTNKKTEDVWRALMGSRDKANKYQQENILNCMDRATKQFTELRKNYDMACEAVHPNSRSHFYVAKPTEERTHTVTFKIPAYWFKEDDEKALINQTGECCYHIIQLCKELLVLA